MSTDKMRQLINVSKMLFESTLSESATAGASFEARCFTYNFPNGLSPQASQELDAQGFIQATSPAEVNSMFGELVSDVNAKLSARRFELEDSTLAAYPDFYNDITQIEIISLSIQHDGSEDGMDDFDDQGKFPRLGDAATDTVFGEFVVHGLDPSKIQDPTIVMQEIAGEISRGLYGQYVDQVNVG